MSSLQDFVNEQKAKGGIGTSSSTSSQASALAASFTSLGDLRSKISSTLTQSLSGIPLIASSTQRSTTVDVDADSESLTSGNGHLSGQLPSSRNRKYTGGWFGAITTSDEGTCGLSRMQRIVAFFMALFGALLCFTMAMMMLPVIVLQARKFAALNTLGSTMLIISFGFLWGPLNYLKHMLSAERRYVTLTYLSTVFITLYTSLWLKSTILTIIFAIVQAIALTWYVLSYAPGGERGLRFIATLFGRMIKSQSKTVLPI